MTVANVSFCNQPKEHYLATSRESRRYAVCGCRYLATLKESKAHFALRGYAPGTIAVNINLHGWKEDSMLVKRIAACTHLS